MRQISFWPCSSDALNATMGTMFSSPSIASLLLNSVGIGLQYPWLPPYGGTPAIYFKGAENVGDGGVGGQFNPVGKFGMIMFIRSCIMGCRSSKGMDGMDSLFNILFLAKIILFSSIALS